MDESERIQRLRHSRHLESNEADQIDEIFASRILALLNDSDIDKHCMVDAYYYDFSVIPRGVQEKLQLWCDAYLIYGITNKGDMVSKWIRRWDLDSEDPIVDGKVIHSGKNYVDGGFVVPEISQRFNPKLLSTPALEFLRIFSGGCVSPPLKNEIDLSKMELCEDCKNEMMDEFMKACRGCLE